ncbi:CBS domain-containing protein [Pleionea sediminis]|uniref:CBS domain-containing protein n=1 Tax=Pleionea sediminis TaxID=2569479 RepID=UPI001185D836|nr:CBS domain-containing protein [Pleionea sediminis]
MSASIGTIMSSPVISINLDTSVEQVEEFLSSKNLSFLPVIDDNNDCFGVVSKTDLVSFHAKHLDEKRIKAWEVCTHQVIQVDPNNSIEETAKLMMEKGIHHVIVKNDNQIVGVVSTNDILKSFLNEGNKVNSAASSADTRTAFISSTNSAKSYTTR